MADTINKLAALAADIVQTYADTRSTIQNSADDAKIRLHVEMTANLILSYNHIRKRLQRLGIQVKELDADPIDIFWAEG